jgi:hypothetical protein
MSAPTLCPHCGRPINPAALLGARGAGKKKTLTPEEREARRQRLAVARASRWAEKP